MKAVKNSQRLVKYLGTYLSQNMFSVQEGHNLPELNIACKSIMISWWGTLTEQDNSFSRSSKPVLAISAIAKYRYIMLSHNLAVATLKRSGGCVDISPALCRYRN